MAKHFPGGGPQKDGEDPHFAYGREQIYPGGRFDLHLQPFEAVLAAGVSQIMPYYGMPVGTEYEEVGFSYNRAIITDLLRDQLGFDGIVCTDWGILTGTFWGVEHLSVPDRMAKALDAGIDQFGGDFNPEVLIDLARSGRIEQDRIDSSVRRLLREKFVLGLFDDPFVDAERAEIRVGTPAAREEGLEAQAAAHTLLQNPDGAAHLPLPKRIKLYTEGFDISAVAGRADVVETPEQADVAVLRLVAPWEQRGNPGSIEFFMHAGSLEFSEAQIAHVRDVADRVPTVVDVYLDRPAILAPLADTGVSLIVNFGATAEAFARVLFGEAAPLGRLPFQIPSSMAAVIANQPDVPGDSIDPTFDYGHGLAYEDWIAAATPTAEDRAATSVSRLSRFDLGTVTLGALLDDPDGGAILAEELPDLQQMPLLDMVRNMPISVVFEMTAASAGTDAVEVLKERLLAVR